MSKTFAQAPKPRPLTAEIITAFERGGPGQDTQTRIPTKVEEERDDKAQTHIPPKKAKQESVKPIGEEPMARLSIDLPKSLHRRFKIACARADLKMVAEAMSLIEQRTKELERE